MLLYFKGGMKGRLFLKSIPNLSYNINESKKLCNKQYILRKWSRKFHGNPGGVESNIGTKLKATEVFKRMLPFLWPKSRPDLKKKVIISISLLIIAKILNVVTPYCFKAIVDKLSGIKTIEDLDAKTAVKYCVYAFILMYGVARLGSSLFNELKNAIFSRVSQGSIRQVSNESFKHLQNLDLDFHLSRRTGMVSKSIDRGTRGISYILTAMAFNLVPTTFEIAMVSTLMVTYFGPAFFLTTFGCISTYSVFTYLVTNWRTKYRVIMNQADNECSSKAFDSFINYETIKYFNNEEYEQKEYDKILKKYEEASQQTISSLAFLNFGQRAIFSTGLSIVMVLATNGITLNALTVGDLVMVNGLLFQLSIPLNFLGSTYRDLRQSFVDLNNLFEILNVKRKIIDSPDSLNFTWPKVIEEGNPVIAFKNVCYSYANQPVLRNLSFEIPFGTKTALVGGSGSGKSTAVRLIYRFMDPNEGDIYLLGQNIKNISIDSLRRQIAVIPQDQVLFHNTIMYNIRYGNMAASDEDVYRASSIAGIHDSIENFQFGYNSQVGERGLKLSGGEKQRVAIARALLKESPILMCDEATSSLDSITEKKIMSKLSSIFKDRTSIIIAHRLSTIVDAHQILVLLNGTVVEKGRHLDLLINSPLGTYSQLWNKQFETMDEIKPQDSYNDFDDMMFSKAGCSKEGCCSK